MIIRYTHRGDNHEVIYSYDDEAHTLTWLHSGACKILHEFTDADYQSDVRGGIRHLVPADLILTEGL